MDVGRDSNNGSLVLETTGQTNESQTLLHFCFIFDRDNPHST